MKKIIFLLFLIFILLCCSFKMDYDVNGDNIIDVTDVLYISACENETYYTAKADINKDDKINDLDKELIRQIIINKTVF